MSRGIIKFVVYTIIMCVVTGVLEYLNTRDNTSHKYDDNSVHYVVKYPNILKYAILVFMIVGVILFCVFSFFYLKNNPTVTKGHLWMSIIFITLSFCGLIWFHSWRIDVDGSQLVFHRLLHSSYQISFSEIQKIEFGKNGEIIIYGDHNKKITVVDNLSDNYDRLKSNLNDYGKI